MAEVQQEHRGGGGGEGGGMLLNQVGTQPGLHF